MPARISVPRFSDGVNLFTPTNIAGLIAWYDASDTATITSSAGAVSQWNDKSGNGYHASQATAGNKPMTGSATQNGLNVLSFDGNDVLVTAATTLAQPVTIFAVGRLTNAAVANGQLIGNNAQSPTLYAAGSTWRLYSTVDANSANATDTTAHQFTAIFNSASSFLYKDATAILSSANPGPDGWTSRAIPIGADPDVTAGWPGEIAEVVVYNSVLSTTDRQSVESYLKSKWGTP